MVQGVQRDPLDSSEDPSSAARGSTGNIPQVSEGRDNRTVEKGREQWLQRAAVGMGVDRWVSNAWGAPVE